MRPPKNTVEIEWTDWPMLLFLFLLISNAVCREQEWGIHKRTTLLVLTDNRSASAAVLKLRLAEVILPGSIQ